MDFNAAWGVGCPRREPLLPRILVVEDDPVIANCLEIGLHEAGYETDHYTEGADALRLANRYDLLLLDLMLPDVSGMEVCRRLRGEGHAGPILLVSACRSVEERVACLDAGADDYLIKPFPTVELQARVRALLRRNQRSESSAFQVGDLHLNPYSRQVRRNGREIRLSLTEFSLLEVLVRNQGQVMTRSTLLKQVWDYDFAGQDNVLEVYISYLRGKVDKGETRKLIHTVRGVGYRLEAE